MTAAPPPGRNGRAHPPAHEPHIPRCGPPLEVQNRSPNWTKWCAGPGFPVVAYRFVYRLSIRLDGPINCIIAHRSASRSVACRVQVNCFTPYTTTSTTGRHSQSPQQLRTCLAKGRSIKINNRVLRPDQPLIISKYSVQGAQIKKKKKRLEGKEEGKQRKKGWTDKHNDASSSKPPRT
jgi:hypothetical protein